MQNKVRKTCIINVSGVSEHPYVLDLSEVVENEVVIDIHDDSDAKILLNYHENTNKTVVFNLGKNSNVVLNILSLKHSVNCNYRFELDTQANILVAFADFATGVSSLNAVFNLNGEYSEAKWHLACLSKNKDKKAFSVNFIHKVGKTYASMNNFGVVEGEGKVEFSGINHIVNGASKSKTYQKAKIMVFDPLCVAKADPILKIDENDVEASHASVVGKVNEEHLFYLCSRGLSEMSAKRLITTGYLMPIADYYFDEKIKKEIVSTIEARM